MCPPPIAYIALRTAMHVVPLLGLLWLDRRIVRLENELECGICRLRLGDLENELMNLGRNLSLQSNRVDKLEVLSSPGDGS